MTASLTSLTRLDRALSEAIKAKGSYRLGALVIRGGSILGTGHNVTKNNPANTGSNWSVHAEVSALRGIDATHATLYVARITLGGIVAMARPCPACMVAIRAAGVNKIVHTTATGAVTVRLAY